MGWEQRGNREYYYQKRRVGKRVVSEYIGTGPDALLITQIDEAHREKDRTEREVLKLRRRDDKAADRELDDISSLVQVLTEASLIADGYHKHKGQWRRKRNGNRNTEHPGSTDDKADAGDRGNAGNYDNR